MYKQSGHVTSNPCSALPQVCAIDDDAEDIDGLVVPSSGAFEDELLKGAFTKLQVWVA